MQNAVASLKDSVDRVRDITVDIDAHVKEALADSAIQARHETTLCAATVILSGFLESFLKDIAEEVITDISNRAIPFSSLPDKVRVTHFWHGANCVREIARQEKSENPIVLAKAADAARRLASVGDVQLPYEIVWEAFAETQANPGPTAISEFLKRFDIDKPLPTLANAMNTTENTFSLALGGFMGVRNECAHTGSASTMPTTTDVRGYCDLVMQIAAGVVSVFQNILAKPPYATPPALTAAPAPAAAPAVTLAPAAAPAAASAPAPVPIQPATKP